MFYLNTKDQLGKFDSKSDEGIFLGYSERSKAYRIFNKRSKIIEETCNAPDFARSKIDIHTLHRTRMP